MLYNVFKAICVKWETWLSHSSYGVYVAVTGSTWLLQGESYDNLSVQIMPRMTLYQPHGPCNCHIDPVTATK